MSPEPKLPAHSATSSLINQDPTRDIELAEVPTNHLANQHIKSLCWSSLSVTVKSRATKQPLRILDDVCGIVRAGEMLAIMGPSGSGKTTLLNALAHRVAAAGAITTGDVTVNGAAATRQVIRHLSTYVEQEDALIGSLTVRETMMFAARLSLPR
jgi:ABC-type multidrug transport system ATPase subunit